MNFHQSSRGGVLPEQDLHRVLSAGCITGVDGRFINPASIDLPLAEEAYRLEGIFLLREGETVREALRSLGAEPHNLRSCLEVGVSYLIRVAGSWELPDNVYAYVNPKSSTGRINLFCRVVADRVTMYDALSVGWKGEMWILLRADSFPVLLSPGQSVSQARLFDKKTFLDELGMNLAIKEHGILFGPNGEKIEIGTGSKHGGSLFLTLRVQSGEIGWECRGTNKVLDYGKVNHYDPRDFFTPMEIRGERLTLHKGSFYILTTDERVLVPPHLSAELRAIDVRLGEFRSHAAGYIDPGWGVGEDGDNKGRPITLEVTPFETMSVSHGQRIARIRYEEMRDVPMTPYDKARSNYTKQNGPKLSKHFKVT